MNSELLIHIPEKLIPRLYLTKYGTPPSFTTIQIMTEGYPTITFFMNGPSDIVAFKNNILWAFEKYIKEQTP